MTAGTDEHQHRTTLPTWAQRINELALWGCASDDAARLARVWATHFEARMTTTLINFD